MRPELEQLRFGHGQLLEGCGSAVEAFGVVALGVLHELDRRGVVPVRSYCEHANVSGGRRAIYFGGQF